MKHTGLAEYPKIKTCQYCYPNVFISLPKSLRIPQPDMWFVSQYPSLESVRAQDLVNFLVCETTDFLWYRPRQGQPFFLSLLILEWHRKCGGEWNCARLKSSPCKQPVTHRWAACFSNHYATVPLLHDCRHL